MIKYDAKNILEEQYEVQAQITCNLGLSVWVQLEMAVSLGATANVADPSRTRSAGDT